MPKFSKTENPMVRAFGSSADRTVNSVLTGMRPKCSGSAQMYTVPTGTRRLVMI